MKVWRMGCLVAALAGSACAHLTASPMQPAGGCVAADELIAGIDALDSQAIRTAFRSFECYDGVEIEDVYRSLGAAFATRPELVTDQMLTVRVEAEYVAPMFTMLPLSFVDNTCGSIIELERRKALIESAAFPVKMKEMFLSRVQGSIERDTLHCSS